MTSNVVSEQDLYVMLKKEERRKKKEEVLEGIEKI